jgi:hypothetical protein
MGGGTLPRAEELAEHLFHWVHAAMEPVFPSSCRGRRSRIPGGRGRGLGGRPGVDSPWQRAGGLLGGDVRGLLSAQSW